MRVWKDNWLIGHTCLNIKSIVRTFSPDSSVCELIDPNLHVWNKELIGNYFDPYEALEICSTPFSFRQ